MSYCDDLVTADPAGAPLDPPILVSADPVLWLALGLLLLAAGLFGWWLGRRAGRRDGDATAAIWKAVDKAAKEAMKADDHALAGRARHLLETLDRRLGRTLSVALAPDGDKGLADRTEALRAAVAGRHGGHGGHGESHESSDAHDDSHDPEGHDAPSSPRAQEGAGPGASAIASGITINVTGSGQDAGAKSHAPRRRDMTAREQTDALRLAVAAFNEHWRHESRRAAELRAALAELAGAGEHGSSPGHD
ncbi:hypothetical protein [Brevundimonas sp.]|uniref:hypothetical protein n=1 Tax=Brevundimonas sp. TaxID=1871086 RepID=UPI0035B0535A